MEPSKYQLGVYEGVGEVSRLDEAALQVEAKAGSGKTTTNIASLKHVPSSMNILEVAFNKSTAEELQKRVPPNAKAQTLNSLGNQTLTKGLKSRPELNMYKTTEICRTVMAPDDFKYMQFAVVKIIDLLKNTAHLQKDVPESKMIEIMDTYDIQFNGKQDKLLGYVNECWQISIGMHYVIDFNDQLFLPIYLGLNFPKYDMVFGDEAQDWNKIQMMMIRKVSDRVVYFGDTNQAIYGFRGADPEAMANFAAELGAKKLPLSICYRCAKNIVKEAQKHVPEIEWWENSPDGIVDNVKQEDFRKKAQNNDFILCRTTAPLVGSCLQFIRDGRKATVKGRDIGQSLIGVLGKISNFNFGMETRELYETMQIYKMQEVEKLERANRDQKVQTLLDQCETLAVFVEQCKTVNEIKVKIGEIFTDNAVGLQHMTIHRSKGLETPNVFILPNKPVKANKPWQKQQEINLHYVGDTRAQRELYFVEAE